MYLYVMRHGPAEDVAETGRDADRALTLAGRARVERVATALAHRTERPSAVLTSPYARAAQTAESVARAVGLSPPSRRAELAPGGTAETLARTLIADGVDGALLVGHEPDLSSLVEALTGEAFVGDFEKAMVVALEASTGTPRLALRAVLEPKGLAWR